MQSIPILKLYTKLYTNMTICFYQICKFCSQSCHNADLLGLARIGVTTSVDISLKLLNDTLEELWSGVVWVVLECCRKVF